MLTGYNLNLQVMYMYPNVDKPDSCISVFTTE